MANARYEIRIEGAVPVEVFDDFEGVSMEATVTSTTIRADLVDFSALNGLLDTLRQQGLVLLDVRRDLWADDDSVLDDDDFPSG